MKNIIYDNNMAFLSESYDENDAILQQEVLWNDFKDEFTRFIKGQVFVAMTIVLYIIIGAFIKSALDTDKGREARKK